MNAPRLRILTSFIDKKLSEIGRDLMSLLFFLTKIYVNAMNIDRNKWLIDSVLDTEI